MGITSNERDPAEMARSGYFGSVRTLQDAQRLYHDLIARKKITLRTDLDIIGDLLQDCDRGKDFVSGDNNYVWFWVIGRHFKPAKIVEMGTRFGYSMKAFVSGAKLLKEEYRLWSYDSDIDGLGSSKIFSGYFGRHGFVIHNHGDDTQSLLKLHTENADLVLVDACHTPDGIFHECSLAWDAVKPNRGVIVIDNIDVDELRESAETFLRQHANDCYWVRLPSLRGIFVVVRKSQS